MSFLSQECCDVCGKQITSLDSDHDLVWDGVRLFADGKADAVTTMPYYHSERNIPDSPTHFFQCRHNRVERYGSSSGPMPVLKIPGTTCSVACVEKVLLEWIGEAKRARGETSAKAGRNVEL